MDLHRSLKQQVLNGRMKVLRTTKLDFGAMSNASSGGRG